MNQPTPAKPKNSKDSKDVKKSAKDSSPKQNPPVLPNTYTIVQSQEDIEALMQIIPGQYKDIKTAISEITKALYKGNLLLTHFYAVLAYLHINDNKSSKTYKNQFADLFNIFIDIFVDTLLYLDNQHLKSITLGDLADLNNSSNYTSCLRNLDSLVVFVQKDILGVQTLSTYKPVKSDAQLKFVRQIRIFKLQFWLGVAEKLRLKKDEMSFIQVVSALADTNIMTRLNITGYIAPSYQRIFITLRQYQEGLYASHKLQASYYSDTLNFLPCIPHLHTLVRPLVLTNIVQNDSKKKQNPWEQIARTKIGDEARLRGLQETQAAFARVVPVVRFILTTLKPVSSTFYLGALRDNLILPNAKADVDQIVNFVALADKQFPVSESPIISDELLPLKIEKTSENSPKITHDHFIEWFNREYTSKFETLFTLLSQMSMHLNRRPAYMASEAGKDLFVNEMTEEPVIAIEQAYFILNVLTELSEVEFKIVGGDTKSVLPEFGNRQFNEKITKLVRGHDLLKLNKDSLKRATELANSLKDILDIIKGKSYEAYNRYYIIQNEDEKIKKSLEDLKSIRNSCLQLRDAILEFCNYPDFLILLEIKEKLKSLESKALKYARLIESVSAQLGSSRLETERKENLAAEKASLMDEVESLKKRFITTEIYFWRSQENSNSTLTKMEHDLSILDSRYISEENRIDALGLGVSKYNPEDIRKNIERILIELNTLLIKLPSTRENYYPDKKMKELLALIIKQKLAILTLKDKCKAALRKLPAKVSIDFEKSAENEQGSMPEDLRHLSVAADAKIQQLLKQKNLTPDTESLLNRRDNFLGVITKWLNTKLSPSDVLYTEQALMDICIKYNQLSKSEKSEPFNRIQIDASKIHNNEGKLLCTELDQNLPAIYIIELVNDIETRNLIIRYCMVTKNNCTSLSEDAFLSGVNNDCPTLIYDSTQHQYHLLVSTAPRQNLSSAPLLAPALSSASHNEAPLEEKDKVYTSTLNIDPPTQARGDLVLTSASSKEKQPSDKQIAADISQFSILDGQIDVLLKRDREGTLDEAGKLELTRLQKEHQQWQSKIEKHQGPKFVSSRKDEPKRQDNQDPDANEFHELQQTYIKLQQQLAMVPATAPPSSSLKSSPQPSGSLLLPTEPTTAPQHQLTLNPPPSSGPALSPTQSKTRHLSRRNSFGGSSAVSKEDNSGYNLDYYKRQLEKLEAEKKAEKDKPQTSESRKNPVEKSIEAVTDVFRLGGSSPKPGPAGAKK